MTDRTRFALTVILTAVVTAAVASVVLVWCEGRVDVVVGEEPQQ